MKRGGSVLCAQSARQNDEICRRKLFGAQTPPLLRNGRVIEPSCAKGVSECLSAQAKCGFDHPFECLIGHIGVGCRVS